MEVDEMLSRTWVISALLSGWTLLCVTAQAAPPALAPNELGQFMVLEYHQIGPGEGRWRRTPENFRRDLQDLYERGYYLTNLNDLLDGKLTVPAGKTPVVLTFDDSAVGQFAYTREGEWDPNTAVGMIEAFYAQHPDFGRAGTFYLNPDKHGSRAWSGMLQHMVRLGYELGNHTVTHAYLNRLSRDRVEAEIAGCQDWIQQNVPGYRVRSIALPFGLYPRQGDVKQALWAKEGESRGVRYNHDALLEVGSGPAPSTFSTHFKPLHIPRIQVCGREIAECASPGAPVFAMYLRYFEQNPGARLVSDGDAQTLTVPAAQRTQVNEARARGLSVVTR